MDQADQIRRQQVERVRYEVDLARRRYMQVDPEKRYVAEVLEAEWNDKLRLLEEAKTAPSHLSMLTASCSIIVILKLPFLFLILLLIY